MGRKPHLNTFKHWAERGVAHCIVHKMTPLLSSSERGNQNDTVGSQRRAGEPQELC